MSDKFAQSSVMPETMATARSASATIGEVAAAMGEASGAVITHEVNSRLTAAAAAAASGSSSAKSAFVASHTAAVKRGGAVGAEVGGAAGAGIGQLLIATARKIGAHQCDACGKKKLYNYWTCQDAACANEQQKLGVEGGYDLCTECHTKLQSGNNTVRQYSNTHTDTTRTTIPWFRSCLMILCCFVWFSFS